MTDRGASVIVVGAGPAGIAAAVRASEAGRDVLLLDQASRPGGQIWRHRDRAELPKGARAWLERLDRSGARLRMEASVVDAESPRRLRIDSGGRGLEIEARDALIVATGATERFLPFPGWTLPGVVGVGGAQALLKSGFAVSGMEVVLAGSGPLLLPVAASLVRAGARVKLVAEQAPVSKLLGFGMSLWRSPARWVEAVRYRSGFLGTPFRAGAWVVRADGDDRLREVTVRHGGRERTIPCQLLCTGYGLAPASEAARLLGCATVGRRVEVDEHQATSVEGVFCAGEISGIGGVDAALVEGQIAGLTAAGDIAEAKGLARARRKHRRFAERLRDAFDLRSELRVLADPSTPICRCEDVTMERFECPGSARGAKLHTRAGMGPCQGRVCQPALEYLFDWAPDSVRPPLVPTAIGTLAAGETGGADGAPEKPSRFN